MSNVCAFTTDRGHSTAVLDRVTILLAAKASEWLAMKLPYNSVSAFSRDINAVRQIFPFEIDNIGLSVRRSGFDERCRSDRCDVIFSL